MRGLFDTENDREDVVRHRAQGTIVADQVQMTILEVGIELRVIGCLHALTTLRKRSKRSYVSFLVRTYPQFIEVFRFIDGHVDLYGSTSEILRS